MEKIDEAAAWGRERRDKGARSSELRPPRRLARGTGPGRRFAVEGPAEAFGRSLAVSIGINVYGEGIGPLRSAVADAGAVAAALERDHGFEAWRIFDGDARLSRLLSLLAEELPKALSPDDRLFFYFAGHGIALDGDSGPTGYLVPADARRADPSGFLSMHALAEALSQLPVRHAFVVLDCCFAGSFRWSTLRDIEALPSRIYRERYDRYLSRPAWQVLTSTAADELALDVLSGDRRDGGAEHSPFALALLEGLEEGADLTGDNVITADELAIFVREKLAPAAQEAGRRQIPQLFPLPRHDGGQFVFAVPNCQLVLEAAPPLDANANPYRGLTPFREENRELFFGREAASQRLVEAVIARPLTVVTGPSGSGKSSLVRAGLIPALRDRGWTVLSPGRPLYAPLSGLGAFAKELGTETGPAGPVAAWLSAIAARPPDEPYLVVVDQFEELVTHGSDAADRTAILEALASALQISRSLRLVVTVRSDAERPFEESALRDWWASGRFPVPRMTRDELRSAIESPAAAAVVHFDSPKLVERLLDDVEGVPAPLPLLSFALSELYRKCWKRWQSGARDRTLLTEDIEAMGGVEGALARRATTLHDRFILADPEYRITIRNVFTRMVAVVGGEIARRRVPCSEFVHDDVAENRRVAEVLERFEFARLILRGTEPGEDGQPCPYAEPSHDILVRGWGKVSFWIHELETVPGASALLASLAAAAALWRECGEDSAYLWRDARVDLVKRLSREHPRMLNADERRFVTKSHKVRQRRRSHRVKVWLVVAFILGASTATAVRHWSGNAPQAATGKTEPCRANTTASRP